MGGHTMQAVRVSNYGGPEQLRLEQVERPQPHEGEVLVRVHAAGVNPIDWKIRQGVLQAFMPMTFPYTPGIEVAGVVAAVGPGVTDFKVGQEVFGQVAQGGYAEYVIASADVLAHKPQRLSFTEAATIPVGATTAWRVLFDYGDLTSEQRVLVVGAAGGVGVFVVQLAKWKGAQVIGTASTKNLALVCSLGADMVIDYTTTIPEQVVQNVDLVFDGVGGATLPHSFAALKRGGTLVSVTTQPPEELAREHGVRAVMAHSQPSGALLQQIAHLIEEGRLKPVVGKRFSLSEVQQAQRESQSGHGSGRIILEIP